MRCDRFVVFSACRHILEHYDEMKFMFDDNRIKDEEMEFHFFK